MDSRERDKFYSKSNDEEDDADYELEPPDPEVLAEAERRGKEVIEASRADINKLLLDKLSEALTEKQKGNKISSLLTKLRRQGTIVNAGSDTAPSWQLAERN